VQIFINNVRNSGCSRSHGYICKYINSPTKGRVYSTEGSGKLNSQTDETVYRAIVCAGSAVHAQSSLTFSN